MMKIPLTKGKIAWIDRADYPIVSSYQWSACDSGKGKYYARTRIPGNPARWERMHRLILGLKPGDKRRGDHRDGNTLDNRRSNLRIVTARQNNENRTKAQCNNTSGLLGVERHKSGFIARIKRNGKRYYLGIFPTAQAAHNRYMEASRALC